MVEIKFYAPSFVSRDKLTYAVIAAIFEGKWIFVRHHERVTWEIAGGHIEAGETPDDAAKRELIEETGAKKFKLHSVADYSVEKEGTTGYGRLYLAEIFQLGTVTDISEIAEITIMDHLPEDLTYPDIQPYLFEKTIEYLKEMGRI